MPQDIVDLGSRLTNKGIEDMSWKDIVKQEEDLYADDIKEALSDFERAKNDIEKIKQEYMGVEKYVEKYVDLLRDYKEEMHYILNATNDLDPFGGRHSSNPNIASVYDYESEAYEFLGRMQKFAEELKRLLD